MSAADRPVAVITGGTRGIGLGVARDLAESHHLVIGGRSAASVDPVVAQLPSAEGFVADLSDCGPGGSLESALELLVPRLPRVDVLVHSAAVLHRGTVADLAMRQWSQSLAANVVSVAGITRALLPALRRAEGLVVMVNSGAGFTSAPTNGNYSATKFALRALADALREEERSNGVRVTSIHPGRVDTDMQREMIDFEGGEYDAGRFLRVESVVRAVRLAVDATPDASIDVVSVRPRGYHPTTSREDRAR